MRYVLVELNSAEPFLRARACETYAEFGDIDFKDDNHIKFMVENIFKNMDNS